MAKVVQLNGQRPGGWSKERWVWIDRVIADGRLSPVARLIACQLGFGFANWETGECRPGADTLAKGCATSVRTVERSLMDLEARGWIKRRGGEAPGVKAAILFTFPGQRPPELAGERPPELAGERPPDLSLTPASSVAPPCTPYKDKPDMNNKPAPRGSVRIFVDGGARPTQLSQIVQRGTDGEADWNRWLEANGFPPLDRIGRVVVVGMLEGWDMPWRFPPSPSDPTSGRVALAFAKWLRSKA